VGDQIIFEQNQRVRESGEEAGRATVRIRNGTFATVVGVVDPAPDSDRNPVAREGDVLSLPTDPTPERHVRKRQDRGLDRGRDSGFGM